MSAAIAEPARVDAAALVPDDERRFGGLRRLYGEADYRQLRAAHVAIVGVGGVGSWTAEALARSGLAALTLIDLDHVAESNINRQVQALGSTIGRSKVSALSERIADIHPACRVHPVEAFVEDADWMAQLPESVDVIVDACDHVRAKAWVVAAAHAAARPVICIGAAGGKTAAERVEVSDLADVTHDPLLAALRQRLRRDHARLRQGAMHVRCVHSREAVRAPADAACASGFERDLNCHGYGSSVAVTATFGFVAAGTAIGALLGRATQS
ncbi:MAG TPA: ThiF family adenylyltransferase [Methylibium sp.]|uniref:tRNA threonylcarbamoyladenosine dehydratase n=1 Tax=Methylibium sp. TaxID=2067992 RepID=UPI002DBD05E9|nr:ThiF family adenylyltransferase [Methylibium sp.]HEU4458448.1 ThiF family adenylyltransferase [Methylibium sp.]